MKNMKHPKTLPAQERLVKRLRDRLASIEESFAYKMALTMTKPYDQYREALKKYGSVKDDLLCEQRILFSMYERAADDRDSPFYRKARAAIRKAYKDAAKARS